MQNLTDKQQNALIAFMDEFDLYSTRTKVLFDAHFLDLLIKYFHYKNICVAAYTKDFRLIQGLGSSSAHSAGQYYLDNGLAHKDTISSYISKHYEEIEANEDVLFDKDFVFVADDSAEIKTFLDIGNFEYRAILPVNRYYRITFFKEKGDAPFDHAERELLRAILIICRKQYRSFERYTASKDVSKIQNDLLNQANIGYITLNNDFGVIDCNSLVIDYISDLWGIMPVQGVLKKIREISPDFSFKNGHISLPGIDINCSEYSEIDYFGRIKQYYYLTFKKSSENTAKAVSADMPALPFDSLSSREMEVLDAFAGGLEYKEISERLFISEGTVRTHLKSIYRKLEISNQRKLIFEYTRYYYT